MISAEQAGAFALAAAVLIAIPGPSVVFVIGRALVYGRAIALATVAGNSLGLLVIVGLVAVGLGAIVQTSAVALAVLKYVGATYLIWLGAQAIRHRRALSVGAVTGGPVMTTRRAAREGFVVGVTNP